MKRQRYFSLEQVADQSVNVNRSLNADFPDGFYLLRGSLKTSRLFVLKLLFRYSALKKHARYHRYYVRNCPLRNYSLMTHVLRVGEDLCYARRNPRYLLKKFPGKNCFAGISCSWSRTSRKLYFVVIELCNGQTNSNSNFTFISHPVWSFIYYLLLTDITV